MDARENYRQIAELRCMSAWAKEKLKEFKVASAEGWQDFKKNFKKNS